VRLLHTKRPKAVSYRDRRRCGRGRGLLEVLDLCGHTILCSCAPLSVVLSVYVVRSRESCGVEEWRFGNLVEGDQGRLEALRWQRR
jgi:hypothetical protein